ncbi:hypothetical protein ACIA7S_28515 [Streptomyces sp. NPDC051643]|uniref:hypothetical protein n=1 Tax=Streptomyces sp. NPDC051643 TaxID=3365665 RepID=UPI003787584D
MSRGRGQPPKIEPSRYQELLEHLRAGLSMPATARTMGVARATLYNLADRDERMGAAMREARESARQAARDVHVPSESCYVNHGCRSPECTAAATEARTNRRGNAGRRRSLGYQPTATRPTVYELVADGPSPLADTA